MDQINPQLTPRSYSRTGLGGLLDGLNVPQIPGVQVPSTSSLPLGQLTDSGLTIPNVPTSLPASIPGTLQDPGGTLAAYAQSQGLNPNDPQVQGYLNSIQQAVIAEGLSPSSQEMLSRIYSFANQYQAVWNNPSVSNIENGVQVALRSARQYVTQNHELSGAISTVQGLVTAFQQAASGSGTPQDIAAAFAGPAVAAAIAAGVVSAGVGAAIVAGVTIASKLLDEAGLFAPKPGVQVCPAFNYTGGGTPTFSINCMAVFDSGGPISPGSINWRKFPQNGNSNDAWWFQPMSSEGTYTTWNNAKWIPRPNGGGYPMLEAFPTWRLIGGNASNSNWDQSMVQPRDISPMLAYLTGSLGVSISSEQSNAIARLDGAYAKAWESNAEFWLNGRHGADIKPGDPNPAYLSVGAPDDYAVFVRTIELWNRAHLPGQGFEIDPKLVPNPVSPGSVPYWMGFAAQVVNDGNTALLTPDRARMHIHTGDAIGTSVGGRGFILQKYVGPGSSQPMSTGAKVAVVAGGTAVAAAAGTGVYAFLTKQAYSEVWSQIWKRTGGRLLRR